MKIFSQGSYDNIDDIDNIDFDLDFDDLGIDDLGIDDVDFDDINLNADDLTTDNIDDVDLQNQIDIMKKISL